MSVKFDLARQKFRAIRNEFTANQEALPQPEHSVDEAVPDFAAPTLTLLPFDSALVSGDLIMDGSGDKLFGRTQKTPNVSAIFVHAGAGYHSTTNEHIHLGACNE